MVRVNGNAGKNTGALLNGGNVVVNGNTDDFTGIDMIKGQIIVGVMLENLWQQIKKEDF